MGKKYYLRYDQAERAKILGLPLKTEKREYYPATESYEGTIAGIQERKRGRHYRELPPEIAYIDYLERDDFINFIEETEGLFFTIEERFFPFSEETTWLDRENRAVFIEDLVFLENPEKPSSYIQRLQQLLEEKRRRDLESAKWYE